MKICCTIFLTSMLFLLCSWVTAQSTPEFPKGFVMHIRLHEGMQTDFHRGTDGFVAGLQALPMWTIVPGKLRAGAELGGFFADKKIGVLAGPAISYNLKTFDAGMFGSLANLNLTASHVWGSNQRRMAGVGLYIDLLNKLVLGISGQRDYHQNHWWLQTAVAIRISKIKKTVEPFNE